MTLADGLSILFILSKNQLLALLIFAMVTFVSFAFISALIFKIYFLLLTLGFSISSFSSWFRCRVRLFIWLFFFLFPEVFLYCYESFPLTLLLQFSIVFGFSLLFVSRHILISFFISSWIVGYSAACCSASICWNF